MNLEPLSPYAIQPQPGLPPEILPEAPDDPWNVEPAARAALSLLIDGETSGDRIVAYADYLLTFVVGKFRQETGTDALLLNGTALALCGYLIDHPEADLWRVTGTARLANEAHIRKAALDNRILATCFSVVYQVAENSDLPILADLITLQERMYGKLVDHTRAERLHVSTDDYASFMKEPVLPEALGDLMRGRQWQKSACGPAYLLEPDQEAADNLCNNLFTLKAHMLVRHQFGSEIDWTLRMFDDKESTVSLAHHGFVREMAAAYLETGDDQYAFHTARLLRSFIDLNPVPNHRQWEGPWRTLEVGNRQTNMWPAALGFMGDTFDADLHALIARSRLEHIRYGLAYCGGPNNWYQVEAAGLAVAALYSPELIHADAYLRIAMRRLKWINSFAYYDDGFQFELTHSYYVFPTRSMTNVITAAQARGVELPADYMDLMGKAHEMYMYAVQPDFTLPMFNDCNPIPIDPANQLQAAAETFNRDDMRWAATHGQDGSPPAETSHAWESAGLYLMRDKWGEDAQYFHFDGAPWGASHQHEDKLNFILYAYGRPLIGDPNIYSYSRTELTHYFKSSRAHNVVMIDNLGQARRFLLEAKLKTEGRNEWVSESDFDFVSSEYLEGYAPDPYDIDSVEPSFHKEFTHRRAVFYVKPGYWILCDLIGGGGTHTLEQIFHLAPLVEQGTPDPVRAGDVEITDAGVFSRNDGVGNIALLPADPVPVRAQKGETSPAVGWYGVLGEFPAWDVTFQTDAELPARMDVVLFPQAPGSTAHPTVKRLHADAHTTAIQITGDDFDDTFILCEEGTGPVTVGDIIFEGRVVLIRRAGEIKTHGVNVTSLTVNA